jgi:mannose-6-phosphate isomerase-like protein (cupin superfamily)
VDAFELDDLLRRQAESGRAYLEFMRVPALSVGLYVLPAGGTDRQKPHAEDEVYYVVSGRATVRVATEEREVRPGTALFVPAGVAHHFHSIQEELRLLVFFGPAESA